MRQQHVPFLRDMVAMVGGDATTKTTSSVKSMGDSQEMKKRARKSQEQRMGEQQLQKQEREQVAFCWRAGWNPVAMTLPLDPSAFWPLATCEMPRMLGTATARSVLPLPQDPNFPFPTSNSTCPCPTLSGNILSTSCVISLSVNIEVAALFWPCPLPTMTVPKT